MARLNLRYAYERLEIAPAKYIVTRLLPTVIVGIIIFLAFSFFGTALFGATGGVTFGTCILLFLICIAVFYPVVWCEREANKIERELHFFITRMGVLSFSEMPAKNLFYMLDEVKEYGRLAVEINKIYQIVDGMKINLCDACRLVAKTTPSKLFADFLGRLAHAIETGEDPREFFKSEQAVLMNEYAIRYNTSLSSAAVLTELFGAVTITVAFVIVLALLLPLIVAIDMMLILTVAIAVFIAVEIAFLYVYSTLLPKEFLWQTTGQKTAIDKKLTNSFFISMVFLCIVCTIVACIQHFYNIFPIPIAVALAITPLSIPAFIALREEAKIKNREDRYPAYIRSLGIAAETKATVSSEVLKKLRHHDFGELSRNINDLHKRLSLRIDELKSWKYFEAETGSDLIARYSDMYIRGARAGGSPKEISSLISDNYVRLMQLRKNRLQQSSVVIGMSYGVAAGVAFSIYITIYLVNWLTKISASIQYPWILTSRVGTPLFMGITVDPSLLGIVAISVMIVYALFSAMIIHIFNIDHRLKISIHFVGLLWTCAITALLVDVMMRFLVGG